MQLMKIEELKPHPRNSEFFDDMSGEKWQEFLKSIKTSGVIEPIVITQDKVIVSGHQRVRACKELGITEIMTEMRSYDSEDKIIKDLLETNIRQRGDIGGSDLKLGRRIKELERIYGVRSGSANPKGTEVGASSSNGTSRTMTDQDIADMNGIDINTLKRAKSLTTLPLEIQDLIEQGNISPSTASRLIAKLTPEQQEQLIQSLPVTEKLTQKQVQGYVDKLKETQSQMNTYKTKAEKSNELKNRIVKLESEIKELEQRKPVLQVKEVVPDDYEQIKKDNSVYQNEYNRLNEKYSLKVKELNELKEQIRKEQGNTPQEEFSKKLKDETIFFCSKVSTFIQQIGGYLWLTNYINELPDYEKKSFITAIDNIGAWYQNLINNIK